MELRRPAGACFTDRPRFVARPNARKPALYNQWSVAGASFPVRVENPKLGRWLKLLGATPDPDDASQLCLQQHELEFWFLRAFTATDSLVSATRTGGGFVIPSRLNNALEALVSAGMDLALDPLATVQGEFTWPSRILIGSCARPLTNSSGPFADLRGFQGIFLDSDARETDQDRFHLVSTAFASHAMVGSLAALPVAHYPSQVARRLVKTTWAPELASVRLTWPELLLGVDDRVTFQTEDAARRAVVLKDCFPVLLLSCSALRHWVSGGSAET